MWRFAAAWPVPALLAWLAAWAMYKGLWQVGAEPLLAVLVACALAGLLALFGNTRWRRIFIAAGFPLSLVAAGGLTGATALLWLAPLLLLLLLYPVASWRDAPLYPTPRGALAGLSEVAQLKPEASIVDAGCGLGAGLIELQQAYPACRIVGLEWSWPLTIASRLRCRFAAIRRADIWATDWATFDMVYLFQRPESMARAVVKARRDLKPGAWLVSLEFEARDLVPQACIEAVPGKPVWIYRAPFVARPDRA